MKTIVSAIALSAGLATAAFAQDAGTEEATTLTEGEVAQVMTHEPSLDVESLTDEEVLIIKQAIASDDNDALRETLEEISAED